MGDAAFVVAFAGKVVVEAVGDAVEEAVVRHRRYYTVPPVAKSGS